MMKNLCLATAVWLACLVGNTLTAWAGGDVANDPFASLPLILEIDTAAITPTDEMPAQASRVETLLGKPARLLPMGQEARRIVYRLGEGKALQAGHSYVLEIEYPDDLPRTFFMANRGADFVRGWATGTAGGDARRQYVEPSIESLAYPQSGSWQRYRQFFTLQERLQGLQAHRNPDPGSRPFTPADGFHLIFFQTYRNNAPRSQGLALGRIRLYAAPDPSQLAAPLNRPPAELPQRRVFWREEMADQAISGKLAADRAFADPLDWYGAKFQLARLLGIDTYAKDLLEFGFNQGWDSGDPNWTMEAQPPLNDLWTHLVPKAAREGFTLLPYYEYKGSLGLPNATPPSLGWQRRAEKLYHGIHKTGDDPKGQRYTGTWWTENHNADLTDPDTLADFFRILDRTILRFGDQAHFAGVWLRTRHTHLPISFSDATVARFRASAPNDPAAQQAARATLIASYESDGILYNRYIEWWLQQRALFLTAIRERLAPSIGPDAQLLFTPWIGEQVPELMRGDSYFQGIGVITDDPKWWDDFAKTQTDGWYRWHWVPTPLDEIVNGNWWGRTLGLRRPINDSSNWDHTEQFHSAPGADPDHYRNVAGVMMTYPIGRMFTVTGPQPIASFQAQSGLTVVHHFSLNENDDTWEQMDANTRMAQPFQNTVGYVAVDVDRAGPLALLTEARAVAYGDPRNIAFLCGSNFSTGFPLEVRRFFQAFQAVPALPSKVVAAAASDSEIVVREVATEKYGIYYFVVNPTWDTRNGITVTLPAQGTLTDLVSQTTTANGPFTLNLEPAALRAYRVSQPVAEK